MRNDQIVIAVRHPPPWRPGRQTALPARLADAGDLPLQRHLAEADPAQAELPQEGPRPAAAPAAVAVADRELRLLPRLLDQSLSRHLSSLCPLTVPKRRPTRRSPAPASRRGRASPSRARAP